MKVSTIFIVGVLALLLSTMPDTIQTFSGSHEYSVKDCEECHSDYINTGDVMADISCMGCHDNQGGSHPVDRPACKSVSCHSDIETLYDAADPHRDLAVKSFESPTLRSENEACFLCHTNINTQFSFIRPQYIEFDIIIGMQNWTIQKLSEGPAASQQILIQREGRSHLWISGTEIQCTPCHKDITANLNAHYPSSKNSSEHPTTGVQCLNCHKKSISQHTARYVLCIECHNQDHTINEHKGLFAQISEQPPQYQANICIGCHNDKPFNKESHSNTHFKVYLAPIYGVEHLE